jgi:glycosyltransferase involved in cell wall biosynthesis
MDSIAVVVAFYNRSGFLLRLLDSIRAQTKAPEIVYIVDNGSREEEAEQAWAIISSHSLSGKCCFVSALNRGNANYARNLGYYLASSRFVAFLDSDDWWSPSHLAGSVSVLLASGRGGCYSGASIHRAGETVVNNSKDIDIFTDAASFLFLKTGGVAQTSSFLIDKWKVNYKVTWDEKLRRHQDTDYFMSIAKYAHGWAFKDKPSSHVDWNEGGAGKSIDYGSMIEFYKKWRNEMSVLVKKNYLLRQVVSCEINRPDKVYRDWYVNEYRMICGKTIHSKLLSSNLIVWSWSLLIRYPAAKSIKQFILKFFK